MWNHQRPLAHLIDEVTPNGSHDFVLEGYFARPVGPANLPKSRSKLIARTTHVLGSAITTDQAARDQVGARDYSAGLRNDQNCSDCSLVRQHAALGDH